LRGLWKQRLRWSRGGAEVLRKNIASIWKWRFRYMWPLLIEFCLSALWAFTFAITIVLWALGLIFVLPENLQVVRIVPPGFTGLVLACVCLMQFSLSLVIERRYDHMVSIGVLDDHVVHHLGEFS
jgi:biofilm PGA synthesis N-glycosyltransferase PgaC